MAYGLAKHHLVAAVFFLRHSGLNITPPRRTKLAKKGAIKPRGDGNYLGPSGVSIFVAYLSGADVRIRIRVPVSFCSRTLVLVLLRPDLDLSLLAQ